MEQLKWVKGNTLSLAVPLVVKTGDGQTIVTTDYVPPTGSEIHVNLVGSYKSFSYDYTIDENVVSFVDNGSLPLGTYGVEIKVKEPDARNLRTFKCQEIKIVNCSDELGEVMPDGQIMLDAAIFVQGKKGDKGDAFTYDDFTPEQIADLKKPATDAAAEVRELEQQVSQAEQGRVDAERLRVQAEDGRVEAEGIRQENEQTRQNQEQSREQAETLRQTTFETNERQRELVYQAAEHDRDTHYQTAEGARNTLYQQAESGRDNAFQSTEQTRQQKEIERQQAEQNRVQAEDNRVNAENNRVLAESGREQAEALRVEAEQQRVETFATYQPQIDAKLDVVTDSQFEEIFN